MQLRSTRLTAIANAVRNRFSGAALDLKFSGATSLDPKITFNRTSNATVTGSNGLIQNAPMNLLTFSEQVDNAAWTKANATITANSEVSPDGSTTADKLVENTANATHNLGVFTAPSFASGVTYTYSLYLKAGERFRGLFTLATASTAFGSVVSANFNLQAKTITAASGSPTVSIEELSNGWFRLTISKTAVATVSEGGLGLRLANDAGATTYTGDGVSGLFIWGAQLELGSTATTYNPTTVKNLLGFTENFDNAAWTKTNAFVQTNLLTNSVFANTGGAAPTGYSQSFGTGVSAPSGTASNGDIIYTQTAAAERPFFVQGLTSVVGITYTNSMTVTAASGLTVAQVIGASGVTSTYTLNGVSVLGSTLVTPGVLASTWTATATNNVPRFGIGITGNATGSISFHGAQVVQGATPGDYKATYAAAAAVGYTDIYGQPFAQKLVENTVTGIHTVSAALTPISATPYTGTVYVKAAERQFAFVGLGQTSNNNFASIDLSTGVVSVASGSPTVSATPLGNGWFRVSVTATSISTNSLNLDIRVSTDGVWDNRSYTGDGTSGIYIFGAQLSDSASVDPYVYQPVAAPASTAYYGPRFDYDPVTLQPKGLLIEEQRTNLLLNTSILGTQVVTVTAAAHTLSFYGTGTIVLSGAFVGTVTGTGAYPTRTTLTFTPIVGVLTVTVTGSVTSAQLEAGAFATSYIPTVASQVTRAADNASIIGNNFARWYNQTEGTLFADWGPCRGPASIQNSGVVTVADTGSFPITGGLGSYISIQAFSTSTRSSVVDAGVSQASLNTSSVAGFDGAKAALGYKVNDFAFSANGVSALTDTLGSVPATVDKMGIGIFGSNPGYLNGTIARIAYWRSADKEIDQLTK